MKTDIDATRPLPGWAEQAARLEGTEKLTVEQIAERVGVSRQTLSIYRNHHPKYLEVRAAAAEAVLAPTIETRELLTKELLNAARTAVGVLAEGLTLVVDGVPQHAHQLECARVLLGAPLKTVLVDTGDTGGKASARAVAGVRIEIVRKDGEEVIVDGEFEDVGHRERDQEGDGDAEEGSGDDTAALPEAG